MPGVDSLGRADRTSKSKLFIVDIDRDNFRSESRRDHDRRQTDTAAAMDSYPLTFSNFSLVDDRSIRCRKSAAKRRGRNEINIVWQLDKICIGIFNSDVVGKAAPSRKSGLELPIADLLISVSTLFARSTAANER